MQKMKKNKEKEEKEYKKEEENDDKFYVNNEDGENSNKTKYIFFLSNINHKSHNIRKISFDYNIQKIDAEAKINKDDKLVILVNSIKNI